MSERTFSKHDRARLLVSQVPEPALTWVRNQKKRSVPFEVGDVMMLTVFCAALGLDPVGCTMDKMTSKGFKEIKIH